MAKEYLSEAFKALNIIEEDAFNITDDGVTGLKSFMSEIDDTEPTLDVIDPLAASEEELQDSYIGKVILDCSICQSKIYKAAEEVTIDESGDLVNVGETCPYCQSSDGYRIIGQVAPFVEAEETEVTTDDENAEVDVEELPEENAEEEKVEEACEGEDCEEEKEEELKEDLNNVQIETDSEKITVTSEPKDEVAPISDAEMIAPLEPETAAQFEDERPEEEQPVDDIVPVEEYEDVEITDFDENEFDGLGESYLKRVYENVQSYKTTAGSINGNTLKLEGVITFKSGKKAKTNFVFEGKTVTKTGKLKFLGENKQFAKGKKAFTLTGRAKEGNLVCESLTYNYIAKDGKTSQSKRLYGRVSR